jgi:hypothetical protein
VDENELRHFIARWAERERARYTIAERAQFAAYYIATHPAGDYELSRVWNYEPWRKHTCA